jgi:hypothetical protein
MPLALALAHEAGAALAVAQLAVARAEVALDAAVVEDVPPAAGVLLDHMLDGRARGTQGC